MKRVECPVQGCNSHSDYPIGWVHLPKMGLYICPDCVMKHCITDGVNVKTLNDIPIKDEGSIEEQS